MGCVMLRACVCSPLCAQTWAMSTPSRAQWQNVSFSFRTWCITPESERETKKTCGLRVTYFGSRNPARVTQADFQKKKNRLCRLSIGEKLDIQYHIQYC